MSSVTRDQGLKADDYIAGRSLGRSQLSTSGKMHACMIRISHRHMATFSASRFAKLSFPLKLSTRKMRTRWGSVAS